MFVTACQEYGLTTSELFEAFDFYDGNNVEKAVQCLLALERQVKSGEKLSPRKPKASIGKSLVAASATSLKQSSLDISSPSPKKSTQNLVTADSSEPELSSPDFASSARQEQSESNLKAVMGFMEKTLNEQLPSSDLYQCLKDGIILCRIMNILSPNSIPVITTKKHPYQQMQNIFNFLKAAREYGVKSVELFGASDLYEGRELQQVVVTLTALARLSRTGLSRSDTTYQPKMPSSSPSPGSPLSTPKKETKKVITKPRLKTEHFRGDETKGMKLNVPDFHSNDNLELVFGSCIGRGQYGAVYKGLNLNNGETVAVKRIAMEDASTKDLAEMMKEVELLKALSHPNVVKYDGFLQQDGYLNIVLEYVENGSLYSMIKQFGPLPEKLAYSFTRGILDGLAYIHSRNVIHCDLKAANILTTKNGCVKLTDFGVSKEFNFQSDTSVAGTPNWMAPEIVELKGATTASDIWSLACTVVEMITGKPPYCDSNPMTVLFKIVEDEMPIPEGLTAELKDFLQCCFNKNIDKRPTARILTHHVWISRNLKRKSEMNLNASIEKMAEMTGHIAITDNRSISTGADNSVARLRSSRERRVQTLPTKVDPMVIPSSSSSIAASAQVTHRDSPSNHKKGRKETPENKGGCIIA